MALTIFGQLVVGPPGSGKTTYCKYIAENLRQVGRNVHIVNLDPANDVLPYKPVIDINDLISVDRVMKETLMGPNGALIKCMETLNENPAWLYDKIVLLISAERQKHYERKRLIEAEKISQGIADEDHENIEQEYKNDVSLYRPYLLIDCPGQSELYTHHTAIREVISRMTSKNPHFDLRLVCINLCDAYHASDLTKFIGLVMNSLSTMMNLELPHVNALSKVDKLECYGKTRFNLDYYCELPQLKYLMTQEFDGPFHQKYKKLSEAICDIVDDYSLVFFVPLNIQKSEDIRQVLTLADKANGYCVDDLDLAILQMNPQLMEMASGRRLEPLRDPTTETAR